MIQTKPCRKIENMPPFFCSVRAQPTMWYCVRQHREHTFPVGPIWITWTQNTWQTVNYPPETLEQMYHSAGCNTTTSACRAAAEMSLCVPLRVLSPGILIQQVISLSAFSSIGNKTQKLFATFTSYWFSIPCSWAYTAQLPLFLFQSFSLKQPLHGPFYNIFVIMLS